MLNNRYLYKPNQEPVYPPTTARKQAVEQLLGKIDQGIYELVNALCPCEQDQDEILATVERFGLPVTTVICKNCGLIRSNPRLSDSSMREFYIHEYPHLISHNTFTANKPLYYATLHQREYHRASHIFKFISPSIPPHTLQHKNSKPLLVDVGTGTGGMMKYFKERGYDVLGCDYDQNAVDYGRSQNLNITLDGPDKLNVDHQADLVILSHVLEHVTSPLNYIDQLASLLKPGGLLYIEVPSVLGINAHRYRNDFLRYLRFQHTYGFTLNNLSNLVTNRGFKLVNGTEWVYALFRYQATPPVPMRSAPEEYKKVKRHLEQAERRRSLTAPYAILVDKYKQNRQRIAKPIIALGLHRPIKTLLKVTNRNN